MELKTVKDGFDHAIKKQKLCYSKCHETVDLIIQEIEQILVKLQASDATASYQHLLLIELKTKLKDMAPLSQLEGPQKELNIALTKFVRQLEKSFNPDISKAYRNVDWDFHTVNQIISSHLYRQGMFDIGDCFINEAGEEGVAGMKSSFVEMYYILGAMKSRDLGPALKWATTNSEKLKQTGSDLELKLHRQEYIEILQKQGRDLALPYARTHLTPFFDTHQAEFSKMMGCILYADRLESSPYADLLSPTHWEKLSEELTRRFCDLLGQSFESPLSVTVAAGVQVLPTLLKLMSVVTSKKNEWQTMKQLTVPVDLDREFQFHTIFVCPVSRDQATDENPPMLMTCGHVLCKHSIHKLSKNSVKSFKCPYCPTEIDASQCKQLHF